MADNWPIYLPNPGLPRSSLGSPCHKEHKSWNMNLLQIHHPATSHTLENRQFASMIYLSNLVIFHGYVKLSEGTHLTPTPRFVWSRAFWLQNPEPQQTTTDHNRPQRTPAGQHSQQDTVSSLQRPPATSNEFPSASHSWRWKPPSFPERCSPSSPWSPDTNSYTTWEMHPKYKF